MPDRTEVISQLERCTLQTDLPIRTHKDACAICHYKRDGRCNFTSLMADALALLKEQEPLVIRKEIVDEIYDYIAECPECGMVWAMWHREKMCFCPGCGKAVKWDD